jgi:hypothetical protein
MASLPPPLTTITKRSIGSAGDLHDATPVLATTQDTRRRSSSDGTRAAEDDMSRGEKHAPQVDGRVVDASEPRGPPFRKFGHKCKFDDRVMRWHAGNDANQRHSSRRAVFDPELVSMILFGLVQFCLADTQPGSGSTAQSRLQDYHPICDNVNPRYVPTSQAPLD